MNTPAPAPAPVTFDDLDDLDMQPVRAGRAATTTPTITCPRCKGKGTVIFGYSHVQQGQCHQCHGSGQVRADWQQRRAAWKKGEATKAARRAQKAADATAAWSQQYPHEWTWIQAATRPDFAASMAQAIGQWGTLTERQLDAVRRCMEQDVARRASISARDATVAGTNGIVTALTKATRAGHTAPALRTAVATFSLAKPASANAGHIYVKAPSGDYLGKITPEGVFKPTQDCSDAQIAGVAAVAGGALEAAIQYGRETGVCSCCGRQLTDPESIAAGIGPICATKFF